MSNFFSAHRGLTLRYRGAGWLGLAGLVLAGGTTSAPVLASCPPQLTAVSPWSDREAGLRTQEQLSETCLKRLVRQCDADAESGFLDGGTAATCSLRYEALLHQGFRGDFHSFLRWWRSAPPVASR